MRKAMACLLTLLLAVCVGGLIATATSAGRLSVSETNFTATSEAAEFENEAGGERITCPVTLAGSFSSRTFAKVREATVGRVTRWSVAERSCTGEAEISVETSGFPVNLNYSAFEGALPMITGVEFQDPTIPDVIKIFHRPFFFTCSYRYQAGNFSLITIRREAMGWKRYVVRASLSLQPNEEILCPERLHIRHEGRLANGAGGTFTTTLI